MDTRWARANTVVTLQVTSDAELLAAPTVVAVIGDRQVTLARDETVTDLQYKFQVMPDLPEGVVRFLADAYGQGGEPAQNPTLPVSVTIDLTPPHLELAASSVVPTMAIADTVVTIRAVFSEPVTDATLALTSAVASTSIAVGANQNGILTFNWRVPRGAIDGRVTLTLQWVADLAGNPLTGTAALPDLVVDTTAPLVSQPGVEGNRYSASAGHNLVRVPVVVDDATAEVRVQLGPRTRAAHSGDVIEFTITSADAEGTERVLMSARDLAGNFSPDVWETITVDHTPPYIVGAPILQFTLPRGCPLTSVTALGTNMTAALAFTTDEPSLQPSVWAGPLGFAWLAGARQAWQFQATVGPQYSSGVYPLQAELEDDVGNRATRTLTQLELATTSPAPLSAAQLSGLLYQRSPWGTATSTAAIFSVSARPATLPSGHSLLFWSGADPTTSVLVGHATADADGGFPAATLVAVDRPTVYAQHYDSACNPEAPTAVAVKNVETVATLGGRVLLSDAGNPHRFEALRAEEDAGVTFESDPAALATLGNPRTDTATAQWQKQIEDVVPTNWRALTFDLDRQRVVAWGDGPQWPSYAWDGTHWQTEPVGAPVAGGVAVYDSVRHVTVLVGGGRTWAFNGTAWVDRGTGPSATQLMFDDSRAVVIAATASGLVEFDGRAWSPVAGYDFMVGPGNTIANRGAFLLGYDSTRHVMLALGGVSGVNATQRLSTAWELHGSTWVAAPPMPTPRAGGTALFDPARGRMVVWGGTTSGTTLSTSTAEFDGTTWTESYVATPEFGPAVFAFSKVTTVGTVTPARVALWNAPTWSILPLRRFVVPGGGVLAHAYDEARHHTVFINRDTAGYATWESDGAQVTRSPAPLLSRFDTLSSGYDPVTARVVLVGERNVSADGGACSLPNTLCLPPPCCTSVVVETWAYDTSWAQLADAGQPVPRTTAGGLAVDRQRNHLMLFGSGVAPMNDLWEFDGSSWRLVAQPNPPSPRFRPHVVWDGARNHLLVGGGLPTSFATALTDAWWFDQGTWVSAPAIAGSTSSAADDRAFFDAALDDLVVNNALFNGTSWEPQRGVVPVGRQSFDRVRGRQGLLSSDGVTLWERYLPAAIGPAHVVAWSCAALGVAGNALTSVTPSFVSGGSSAVGQGARLKVWLNSGWVELTSTAAAPSTPATVSSTITGPMLAALCDGGVNELTFEVTTMSGSDYSFDGGLARGNRAVLTTDYTELRVRTQLP